jgi:hypothetical protein
VFVHDQFICLQLQKCASVRLGEILREHLPGEMRGHHERIDFPIGDRQVIGAVRDPWGWYVSLWAFGCKGSGGVRYRLTDVRPRLRSFPRTVRRAQADGRPLREAVRDFAAARRRNPDAWRHRYGDVDDPERFRSWLRGVLDPATARVLDPLYGSSRVAEAGGLLTWRYLRLFVRDLERLAAPRGWTAESLAEFDARENACRYVMRIDRLGDEIVAALDTVGVALDDAQRASIREAASVRSNTSRHLATAEYYDEATLALVAERERFLIDKHGFMPPRGAPARV